MLALRSVFFALLLPGSVTLFIPYLILSGAGVPRVPQWTPLQYDAVPVMGVGFAILVRCIVDFARQGKGTLVLVSEVALFRSVRLLEYTVLWFVLVNLFVILYEEPTLQRKFGASYEHYRRSVGRWIPRRMP